MPSPNDKFARFTLLLTPEEHANLKANAYARETTANGLIRAMIKPVISASAAEAAAARMWPSRKTTRAR